MRREPSVILPQSSILEPEWVHPEHTSYKEWKSIHPLINTMIVVLLAIAFILYVSISYDRSASSPAQIGSDTKTKMNEFVFTLQQNPAEWQRYPRDGGLIFGMPDNLLRLHFFQLCCRVTTNHAPSMTCAHGRGWSQHSSLEAVLRTDQLTGKVFLALYTQQQMTGSTCRLHWSNRL